LEIAALIEGEQSIIGVEEILVVTLNVVKFYFFYYSQPILELQHQLGSARLLAFVAMTCKHSPNLFL
jgi:hypothetical protein